MLEGRETNANNVLHLLDLRFKLHAVYLSIDQQELQVSFLRVTASQNYPFTPAPQKTGEAERSTSSHSLKLHLSWSDANILILPTRLLTGQPLLSQ